MHLQFIESLEARRMLATTAVSWTNTAGTPLADLANVVAGDPVNIRVDTIGMRGKWVRVEIWEDDGGWTDPDYLTAESVQIPLDDDVGWIAWNTVFRNDNDGLNREPEWRAYVQNADQNWVGSERLFVLEGDDDPDGRMARANAVPQSQNTLSYTDAIDNPYDVDMFSFQATGGQTLNFDIDTPTNGPGGLGSLLRLFDADGNELADNNDAAAPGEQLGYDSYIQYQFAKSGRYFVSVSNYSNTSFSPVTGKGDSSLQTHSVGEYTLSIGNLSDPDADDQISEARRLTFSDGRATVADTIGENDVDIFAVEMHKGDVLAIDIDRRKSSRLDSFVWVFNKNGKRLAYSDNSAEVREDASESRQAYLEYTARGDGMYFVGVSSRENITYNPLTGEGDQAGATGAYRITLTQIVHKVVSKNSFATGHVNLPNAENYKLKQITPVLVRIGDDGKEFGAVEAGTGKKTWVVIHGRADQTTGDKDWTRPMASLLARMKEDGIGQALVLDWNQGAADNHLPQFLDGARWIRYVGQWLAKCVIAKGIDPKTLFLAGHSWGSWVAYEAAKQLGFVGGIVAMDPAASALGTASVRIAGNGGYDASVINFRSVAKRSWAFYGGGAFGDPKKAGTAQESFYTKYFPPLAVDPFTAHAVPKSIFRTILFDHLGLSESPTRYSRARRFVFNFSGFMGTNSSPIEWDVTSRFEGFFTVTILPYKMMRFTYWKGGGSAHI